MSRSLVLSTFVLFLMVIWTASTILILTWGVAYNWPDYVHVNYGFPYVWAIHTLNTIAGPVDKWRVDITALVIDLVFWLGLMVAAIAIILFFIHKKK